jgi:hypothetical protein
MSPILFVRLEMWSPGETAAQVRADIVRATAPENRPKSLSSTSRSTAATVAEHLGAVMASDISDF